VTPSLFLITDPRWPLPRVEEVIVTAGAALPPGSLGVQLRDKAASAIELARAAERLRASARRVSARFVVNAPDTSTVRMAREAGADGVHVPCTSAAIAEARDLFGADAWISTPAHAGVDVVTAEAAGATAVLVSPIFATPGKGPPRGVEAIRDAREGSRIVVLALGGVDATNARACAEAGAHGVAVVRALLDAPDVAALARALHAPFRAAGVV
jgi:thiamine-phosphate pyrophosphorylase